MCRLQQNPKSTHRQIFKSDNQTSVQGLFYFVLLQPPDLTQARPNRLHELQYRKPFTKLLQIWDRHANSLTKHALCPVGRQLPAAGGAHAGEAAVHGALPAPLLLLQDPGAQTRPHRPLRPTPPLAHPHHRGQELPGGPRTPLPQWSPNILPFMAARSGWVLCSHTFVSALALPASVLLSRH